MKKKSKNKTILCTYTLPIFPTKKLVVIISNNTALLKYKFHAGDEYIDWKDVDAPGTTFYGYTLDGDDGLCILIVIDPSLNKTLADVDNVCAHEALHGAYHILEYLGILLNDNTNEVYAYVTGWVTECTKDAYYKWQKKN